MSKRRLQGMVVGMLAVTVVSGWNSVNVAAATMEQVKEHTGVIEIGNENGTRNTQYVWVTKTEKGIKYKRLYDATNKKWLTDWIRCN